MGVPSLGALSSYEIIGINDVNGERHVTFLIEGIHEFTLDMSAAIPTGDSGGSLPFGQVQHKRLHPAIINVFKKNSPSKNVILSNKRVLPDNWGHDHDHTPAHNKRHKIIKGGNYFNVGGIGYYDGKIYLNDPDEFDSINILIDLPMYALIDKMNLPQYGDTLFDMHVNPDVFHSVSNSISSQIDYFLLEFITTRDTQNE